jgi:N,N'-diacetyllegionaminate synthase
MRAKEKTQFEMLKNLELSFNEFKDIKKYCNRKKIEFISTPYDIESAEFLNPLVTRFKIPSAEIVNKPLLEAVSKFKKQIILSTGMATFDEIKRAISLIKANGNKDIVLLHCTTSYPTPYNQVNMNMLKTLKTKFDLPVGYSDHTLGIEIPIMAVSYGAEVIEKHFTLDRKMEGPDHYASLEPDELEDMVEMIRKVEKAFGKKEIHLTKNEKENIYHLRRSIHSNRDIGKGKIIKAGDINLLRPDDGLSPWLIDQVVGKRAKRNIKKDQPIRRKDV